MATANPASISASRLPRTSPESVGIESAGIQKFLEAVNTKVGGLHGFLLLRHGKVAAEGWWTPYAPQYPHMLYSLSKSFTSTAVGLAIEEGKFTLESPVTSFFPKELPSKVGANLAAMRVEHLLMMSTGHDKDATGPTREDKDGDWVKGFLSLPVEHAPGSKFVYNSAATYLLSAIVQKTVGKTVLEYLTPRLLTPLGIEGATWEVCPKGINTGGWGLAIKTEDI
ncbi:MAG: serine hydrolase, partial [Chthonomonadaceae bacterium]|nr:serine hydrolase [Chthonomonadaceae bacterium]